jgi:dihydropyrimidinase
MVLETYDLVVRGGTVVNADGEVAADVGVSGGRIAVLGAELSGRKVIDAQGLFVLPGGVDPHVHLSPALPPGAPAWVDDFSSGTRAAAAGGITTVGNMTFPWPGQTLLQAVERDVAAARRDAVIDVAFHPVLTDPQTQPLAEIPLLAELGHTSLKFFMSFGGFTSFPERYLQAMRAAKAAGMMVLVHCEDAAILDDAMAQLVNAGHTAPHFYPLSRPIAAEAAATARVVAFAEQTGAPTYIVHLSCAAALDEVHRGRARGLDLSVETRPLYLFLSDERFNEPDAGKYFGQPPLRSPADRDALWQALVDGEIDSVATDHAPWRYADKTASGLDITSIPPGVADLDVMLPLLWSEGVTKRRLSRSQFVSLSSTFAARALGLYPKKGTIAPGSDADLVIWNPHETRPVRAGRFASNSDYSPYEGWPVTGWPRITISRGQAIASRGVVDALPGRGQIPPRARIDVLRGA